MFSSHKSDPNARDRRQSVQQSNGSHSTTPLAPAIQTQSSAPRSNTQNVPNQPPAFTRQSMDFNPSSTPSSSLSSRNGPGPPNSYNGSGQGQGQGQGQPISRSMSSQTIGADSTNSGSGGKSGKRKTFLGMHFGKDKGEKETSNSSHLKIDSNNGSSPGPTNPSSISSVNSNTSRQSFSSGTRPGVGGAGSNLAPPDRGGERQRTYSGASTGSAEGRVGMNVNANGNAIGNGNGVGGGGAGSPLAMNGDGLQGRNGYMDRGGNGTAQNGGFSQGGSGGGGGMRGSQSMPFGMTVNGPPPGNDRRASGNDSYLARPANNSAPRSGPGNNPNNMEPNQPNRLVRPGPVGFSGPDGLDPPQRSFGNNSSRPGSERSGSGTGSVDSGDQNSITPTGMDGPGTGNAQNGQRGPQPPQDNVRNRTTSNASQAPPPPHPKPTSHPSAPHRTPSSSHAPPSTFSTTSTAAGPKSASQLALEKVFEGLLGLIQDQGRKLYGGSPPEVELIVARATHGGQPKQGPPGSPSNDWDGVWMQLTGTSLSVWSMKETAEADKRGERVPPTYYNITDSSLELLAPLPPPPHRPDSHPHPFVFSLNTAGSNRILFSCPTESNLTFWVTALRLASWEKSRIEEIYTGHVLRTYIKDGRPPVVSAGERPTWNEPSSPLRSGKMEGWVRVRVMGGVEWKRLWLVLTASEENIARERQASGGKDSIDKKRRSIFGRSDRDAVVKSEAGVASTGAKSEVTSLASAVFYQGPPPKPSQRAKSTVPTLPPVLTITHVSQAYAVFPEHLEVITSSNLLKVVGHISGEMVVVEGRQRLSGWAMIMPERSDDESPMPKVVGPPIMDMLNWATGFHDAFGLYGRPANYDWHRENPESLFFAYPSPPGKERLFLDAGVAQHLDYRIDAIAEMRKLYGGIVRDRLRNQSSARSGGSDGAASPRAEQPHMALPDGAKNTPDASPRGPESGMDFRQHLRTDSAGSSFQLPPLDFNGRNELPLRSEALTPITERSDVASRKTSIGTLNTVNIRSIAGSQSSKGPGGTGSGSSGGQLGRNPSFGTRLETALVAENLTTSPGLHDGPDLPDEPKARDYVEPKARDYVSSNNGRPGVGNNARSPPVSSAQGRPELHSRNHSGASGYSQSGTDHTAPNSAVPSRPSEMVSPPQTFVPLKTVDRPRDTATTTAMSPDGSMTSTNRESFAPQTDQASPSVQSVIRFYGEQSDSTPGASPDLHGLPQPQILSPAPQKSRGSFVSEDDVALQENTVAMYLMSQAANDSTSEHQHPQSSDRLEPRTDRAIERQWSGSSSLGRKPSGARAMPPKRSTGSGSSAIPLLAPIVGEEPVQSPVQQSPVELRGKGGSLPPSHTDDALAAMSYLDKQPSPVKQPSLPAARSTRDAHPGDDSERYKSSFAPSKGAAKRRAKAREAEVRENDKLTRPGRSRQAPNRQAGREWDESSDEEEESEEEEEDADADQEQDQSLQEGAAKPDDGPQRMTVSSSQTSNATSQSDLGLGRPVGLRPMPEPTGERRRTSRGLPQIPGQRAVTEAAPSQSGEQDYARHASWGGQPQQPEYHQQSAPQPRPLPKPSPWTTGLGEGHGNEHADSTKFVTLEPPSSMTKAFSPHGLLQAGMQDKEDRSARKQEEVAREAGASLVNVPNKPPPPQAGLLGAISGYERDRQNAGGIGAALTERERDRRLAEERQRQIGDLETLQRQQALNAPQSVYGLDPYARPMSAYGGGGIMPGMMPMAYGQQPNGMMWGNQLNPYAQQQAMAAAQMAYQTSMYMAMSNAGSQYGGDNGRSGGEGRTSPMPAQHLMGMGMGMGMMNPQPFMSPPFMGSPAPSQYSGFPGISGYHHQSPPNSANQQGQAGSGYPGNREASPRPPQN